MYFGLEGSLPMYYVFWYTIGRFIFVAPFFYTLTLFYSYDKHKCTTKYTVSLELHILHVARFMGKASTSCNLTGQWKVTFTLPSYNYVC
jgi:hypothetical protein